VFLLIELLGRTLLLRSLIKLILHLQQTNSSSDSMRRLIDSSLPATLKTIFNDSRLFSVGLGVFGLAVNIMSTFVHIEPTSLSILQEQGVVAAFLEASKLERAPSLEVVSAFPSAFGAVCLNPSGLKAFVESNPIPKFLEMFTLKHHLPSFLDNDVPLLVGNAIDKLIRHHPTTRDIIMNAVVQLVEKVKMIAQDFGNRAYQYIDVLSRVSAPFWNTF
jgi:E3 ubiquitin-protein ligase HUWE1